MMSPMATPRTYLARLLVALHFLLQIISLGLQALHLCVPQCVCVCAAVGAGAFRTACVMGAGSARWPV